MSFHINSMFKRITLSVFVFMAIVANSNIKAQHSPVLEVIVSDAVGMPNEQGIEVAVYMKNYTDTIAGFSIWIQLDRPDIISIQEAFDTTGTLTSGWQFVNANSIGQPGSNLHLVGIANMYWQPIVPGIGFPQYGDVPLIKFYIDVLDIPDFITDRESNMIINTDLLDYFNFSDPDGNSIGISFDTTYDTTYYNCEAYDANDSCLSWVQVPGPNADTMVIEEILVPYLDTNLVYTENGYFTIGLCGDFDGNGTILDIADLVFLVEFMFGNPPGVPPTVMAAANIDGSEDVDIADLVYAVEYMFGTPPGPPPVCP